MSRLSAKQIAVRDIGKIVKSMEGDFEQMASKYEKLLRDELNYIARSSIDAFYEDYEPSSYRRYGDIYNTYKIEVKRDQFESNCEVHFAPKYMKHHGRLNSYIYDIVFEQGWHGGAIEGPGHPEPGVPWYRNLAAIASAGEDYDFH